MFNELLTRIKQLKDDGLETTLDYKVDLMIYMEELAVKNFTSNQNAYEKKSSPQALLQKKKKLYHKIFETKLGEGNALVEMMKDIVESNLEDRLTHTELMQILRDHGGDVFRSTQALQASIMVDLLA